MLLHLFEDAQRAFGRLQNAEGGHVASAALPILVHEAPLRVPLAPSLATHIVPAANPPPIY